MKTKRWMVGVFAFLAGINLFLTIVRLVNHQDTWIDSLTNSFFWAVLAISRWECNQLQERLAVAEHLLVHGHAIVVVQRAIIQRYEQLEESVH